MAKARAHAPNQPALDLERILEMAKRTPYYEECLEAIDLLTNPARWSYAETTTSESIPPSRVRKDFVDDMVKSDIITEFNGTPLAWGLLTAKAEPGKAPPRWRMISDMLWSNATLDESRKVILSTMEELFAMGARNKFGATFDFQGWFYSLPVGEWVQPYTCFLHNGKIYAHKRGPMGHKWFVFIAHTLTKVIAWDPTVEIDVIIDNVFYASNDEAVLNKARAGFITRSENVLATLGEATPPSPTVTYRGLVITMGKSVTVKTSWLDKLRRRIDICCAPDQPTAAMLFSLGGMISWLRGILGHQLLDNYWMWRTIAKAATCDQWKRIELTEHSRNALKAISQWSTTAPEKDIRTRTRPKTLIVTDASLAKPLGRWGAMTVTSTLRCFGGLFPIPLCKVASIADLETAAILLTLYASPGLRNSDIHAVTDNQVTDLVLRKRRCSAWRLHSFCKAIHANVSALGSNLTTSWIPSAANPTDGISRGHEVTEQDVAQLQTLTRKFGMEWEGISYTNRNILIMEVSECNDVLLKCLSK